MTDFNSLNLQEPIANVLETLGYKTPTPIQAQAIPLALAGKDVLGLAQTGTGKTAAFSLPMLNHLCLKNEEPPKKRCFVLILAPTRELVTQIAEQVRSYGRNINHLSVVTVFGGTKIVTQIKRLSGGADIVVATPGRLVDLLDRGSLSLSDVEILILDEADQMMDMGFIHALKKIVPLVPKDRQTLLFSATMVPKIKKLAAQFLNNPASVSVAPNNSTAEKVEQRITFVNKNEKMGLLALCLLKEDVSRAIVFTRTKHGADRVVKNLRQMGIDSRAIHGNKSQSQRQRALGEFKDNKVNILVATDVAARGIDIPNVSHVFNYEIPNVPEQYVHRIGRTGRADKEGIAHAFVSPDEKAYLKDIQKLLKTTVIEKVDLPEDFVNQSRALKSRPAIAAPEKPKPDARKGRGKSRKKSDRYSDDKKPSARGDRKRSKGGPKKSRNNDFQPEKKEPKVWRQSGKNSGKDEGENKQPRSASNKNSEGRKNTQSSRSEYKGDRNKSRSSHNEYKGDRKKARPPRDENRDERRKPRSGRDENNNERSKSKRSYSDKPYRGKPRRNNADGETRSRDGQGGERRANFKRKPRRADNKKPSSQAGQAKTPNPNKERSKNKEAKTNSQRNSNSDQKPKRKFKGKRPNKGSAPKGQAGGEKTFKGRKFNKARSKSK